SRASLISSLTAGVRPLLPIRTTGLSPCPSRRRWRFWSSLRALIAVRRCCGKAAECSMADASVRVPASGFSGIRRRHGVDALNSVKLELGLAVLLCITVALVLAVLPLARWLEFVLLVAFTMAAAGWVMLRTRR